MAKNNNPPEEPEGKRGMLVNATIPKDQYKAIVKLEGTMGVSRNEVVGNIINMWLYSQNWFLEIINQKVKEGKK